MRNVFDQYSQPENQLTHALICALASERNLLRPFLHWAGVRKIPPLRELNIVEQQIPGEFISGEEDEARGLPDACIFDHDGWAMLIEAKVQAGARIGQLRRHLATAARHGFEQATVLLISVDLPRKLPGSMLHCEWRDVYAWFRNRAHRSVWAGRLADYMEVFEARMIAEGYGIRGTITMFDGLRFDTEHPYNWLEGKRLIRLLGDDLQARKDLQAIGVDPTGARRSAITGRGTDGVWDFLPLKIARGARHFTAFPHLTMGIHRHRATAAITVPNGVRGGFRSRLKAIQRDGFRELIRDLHDRVNPVLGRSAGSKAMAYATQRHYKSQRSIPETDARLDVDLRTIVPGRRKIAKHQPQWLDSIYEVLIAKNSNVQFGIDVHFRYKCPIVRSHRAVGLFADSWKAMTPLLDFVLEK